MVTQLGIEPMDSHNRALIANAHPANWVNPQPDGRYNMVVIGAGTAGLVTAAGVAGLGGKVAIVERHLMGGDCLNYGCVPSKALIRSSRAAHAARNASRFGVNVTGDVEVDFEAVMDRLRRLRSHISEHDSAKRFHDMGVDVFIGDGRFVSADTIEVEGAKLQFARACIATGGRAAQPPIEGLAEAGFLTNETVFSLTKCPKRLAVLGGGPIGCELGQAFGRLGCQVSIFQRRGQVLPKEDEDVAGILQSSLDKDGVNLLLNSDVKRISVSANEKIIHYVNNGNEKTLTVDEILVAVGRAPNVEGLNLEVAGVEYDTKSGVLVDDNLKTTNAKIFAAGDICMRYKFTHAADAAARIVIQNALFWGRKKLSAVTIPWCTYTDPEIAHVGISQKQAGEQGIEIETFTRDFDDVDRAILDGQTKGLAKIHIKKDTDKILGATVVASHAGSMINEITLAMATGVGLGTIANIIHPYPTQAEAIKQLGDAYNRTRLSPGVKKLFAKLLAWRR